ncbi:hypothetical protein JCM17823_29070 [Halorubrum gandharaense]
MHVTAATAEDVDAVADLWVDLASDQRDHGSTLLASDNLTAVRESIARHVFSGEVFLARSNAPADDEETRHDPIGFVSFSLEHGGYERDRRRGVVENLYVVPEHRGEGVGSALLDAAERALAESGAETVALEALVDNERARAFYRDHGYDPHRVELTKPVSTGEKSGDGGSEGESAGGTE